MDRRRFLMTSLIGAFCAALAVPLAAGAQQARKAYRIGWLLPTPPNDRRWEAFKGAMAERGWLDGRDFTAEWRSPGVRPDLAEEAVRQLLALNVDLIVAAGSASAAAAQRVTRTVPIVMLTSGFPVEAGIAASLSRPGGNVTGNTLYAGGEVFGKLIQFLREITPASRHLGVLWDYASPRFPERENAIAFEEIKRAADHLGMRVSLQQLQVVADVEPALGALATAKVDSLLITGGQVIQQQRKRIVDFALERRIAMVTDFSLPEQQRDNLLIYSPDPLDLARQAARYVDQIFRGAKPGELPILLPAKFRLIVNVKIARDLGVTIPPSILVRADQVIE